MKPQQEQCHFIRSFTPKIDALYVPDDKWADFCVELTDRMGEPDLVNRNLDATNKVTRIAVSETLFLQTEVSQWLPSLQIQLDLGVIFVVVGTQPDVQQGPWRWELEGIDAGAFVWNMDSREFEFQQGTGTIYDEDVYRKIAEATLCLRERMVWYSVGSVEVRPVSITRK